MPNFFNRNNVTALTGGEAVALAMKQIEPEVVPVYPITPQTPIIEKFIDFVADGKVKSEVVTCESEHSVMSVAVGAASSGARSMTATSSVGLAFMFEMLGVASGMRLPIVMNIASRALSSPLNIHCDHSDVMGVRETGWIQIFSETAQEAYDHNFLALKIAENRDVHLPAMVVQDGFITSHLLERVETLAEGDVKDFIGDYSYPFSLLQTKKKITFGSLAMPRDFFKIKKDQFEAMERVLSIFKEESKNLSKLTGRNYPEVETFQINDETEAVVVIMGGMSGLAKEVAKEFWEKGHKVGVLKVRLFRPFPAKEVERVLSGIEKIAVLDRSLGFGDYPPLCSSVLNALFENKNKKRKVGSYVYGLGGSEIKKAGFKKVFSELLTDKIGNKINFIEA